MGSLDKLKILAGMAILGHCIACIIAAILLGLDIHNTKWDIFSTVSSAILVYAYYEKRGWTNGYERR